MADSPYQVEEGKRVKLKKWATDDTGRFRDKQHAAEDAVKNLAKLRELQNVLYAQGEHSVLIILQAMDAGGKDGAVDHVFSGLNPQGCQVTSFKIPTPEERAHDFLWRHHLRCPGRGMIGIHNRSHYETVLVERVKSIVPRKVWSRRYGQINDWESMLASEGTVILKFFLHISKEEQKKRMQARLNDESRNWKFNPGDLDDRKLWDDYQEAYEELLERCSTKHAPWFVVPADHKWFRNWVISDAIVRSLEKLDLRYPKPLPGIEKIRVV